MKSTDGMPRRKPKPCPHYVDNQGRCHQCGILMEPDWWNHYIGAVTTKSVPKRKKVTR